MKFHLSVLTRSLLFSFVSYLFVLFLIIVMDTFRNKDFDFFRAGAIGAAYLGAQVVLFAVMLVVFRKRLKQE